MLTRTRQIPHSHLLFLLAYLYIWLVVEPRLIYHGLGTMVFNATVFSTEWSFVRESFGTPGGAISYVGGFLSQGYSCSWLGALIIVVMAWCLCELAGWHFLYAGYAPTAVLVSVPAVILFLMVGRYKQPMAACLTVSSGLVFSYIFERLPLGKSPLRVAVYGIMAVVSLWLTGTGGLLVFSLMNMVYGVLVRRDWVGAGLALPASVLIVWSLAEYVFYMTPWMTFLTLTPFSEALTAGMNTFLRGLILLLYGFVPLALSLMALGTMVLRRTGRTQTGRSDPAKVRKAHTPAEKGKAWTTTFKRLVNLVVPILLTAVGLWFTYNPMDKAFMLSNMYSLQKQWDKVLDLARHLPKGISNVHFNHCVNRALFHTGRLPYEMFHFPQMAPALLLTHESRESALTELQLCDAFMELGEINTAERLASEFLTAQGNLGVIIEKLAWIHIVKGDQDTARVYLNALKGDLVYRHTAASMLKGLAEGFKPDEAAYVERLRSRVHSDTGYRGRSVDLMLSRLLEHDPSNKMAFEYLMACYLLTGQLDKIVAQVGRLSQFGYPDIPSHYEEAILLYCGQQGQKVDLRKFPVRQETVQRYVRFAQLNNSIQPTNLRATMDQLGREMGDSYFFYYRVQCMGQGRVAVRTR